jgi:hypothetical protein
MFASFLKAIKTTQTVNKILFCSLVAFVVLTILGFNQMSLASKSKAFVINYTDCDYGGACEVTQGIIATPIYTPNKGVSSSAIYSSSEDITASLKGVGITTDVTPQANSYYCMAKTRTSGTATAFQELKDSTGSLKPKYDPATGCTFKITKAIRANSLAMDIEYEMFLSVDNMSVGKLTDTYTLRVEGI